MLEVMVTEHACERMNIKNKKGQIECAEKAYFSGLKKIDCRHGLDERLLADKERGSGEYEYRIFRDRIFVFCDGAMLTVLPLDFAYYKRTCKNRAKENKRTERRFV